MRNDRHIALRLRRSGKSYKEIRQELNVPLSTLSDWFAHLSWSTKLKRRLIKKTGKVVSQFHKARWEAWRQVFRDQALVDFPNLYPDPLFVAGICLYWGEGDNQIKNSLVRLVNTDPKMIALFCQFLRKLCSVPEEKIKASLVLYPDLSDKKCKTYWSKVSEIPSTRFHKTQFIHGRHPTKKTTYGMCTIYVSSRELKEKIFVWRDLLYKQYES